MKGIAIVMETADLFAFSTVLPSWEGDFAKLQETLGGWVEVVPSDGRCTFWCNEDGKGTGLPRNYVAEMVWKYFDIYGCLSAGDWLAGNIIITGPADEEGTTTDISDDMWMFIMSNILGGG